MNTLLRSLLLASSVMILAWPIAASLKQSTNKTWRTWMMTMVVSLLLTPSLLPGYCYRTLSIAWGHAGHGSALLYFFIMLGKLLPLAVLILRYAPQASVSGQGIYLAKLLPGGKRGLLYLHLKIRGQGLAFALAWLAVWGLAFGEFEIASLLQMDSWSVGVFDRLAVSASLTSLLGLAFWPMLLQLMMVGLLLYLLLYQDGDCPLVEGQTAAKHNIKIQTLFSAVGTCLVIVSLVGILIWPGLFLLTQAQLVTNPTSLPSSFLRSVFNSVAVSLLASGGVYWLSKWPMGRHDPAWGKRRLTFGLALWCVPGLLGSLLISLLLLAALQWPMLHFVRDTPVPVILGLMIWLFPWSLLLRALWAGRQSPSSLQTVSHLAHSPLAQHRKVAWRLRWQLVGSGQWTLYFILFLLAYFDMHTGVLLKPTTMSFAPELLHHLMHYGRYPSLSGMMLIYLAMPAVLFLAGRLICWVLAHVAQLCTKRFGN